MKDTMTKLHAQLAANADLRGIELRVAYGEWYLSMPVGHAEAFELQPNDDEELTLFFYRWDRTGGLAEETWIATLPADHTAHIECVYSAIVRGYIEHQEALEAQMEEAMGHGE